MPIAVWASGAGRPVLLVHGTTSDHNTFDELVPHLEDKRRVYRYDRRGRGLSGDGPPARTYSLELEFADAAAVAEYVAAEESAHPDVLSHSFGAYVALGAAAGDAPVASVVAYSPGFGAEYPPGALDRIETAISGQRPRCRPSPGVQRGHRDAREGHRGAGRLEGVAGARRRCLVRGPGVPGRRGVRRVSGPLLAGIRQPVLVLDGERNVPAKRELAAALAGMIPGAVLDALKDEGHAAHHTSPAALTERCLRFFDEAASSRS